MTEPKPTYDAGQPDPHEIRLAVIKDMIDEALIRGEPSVTVDAEELLELIAGFQQQVNQLADLLQAAAGIEEAE